MNISRFNCSDRDAMFPDPDGLFVPYRERLTAERAEAERTLATIKDELPRLRSKVLRLERDLARRVPNQDDLRTVLDNVRLSRIATAVEFGALARVRATMEEA